MTALMKYKRTPWARAIGVVALCVLAFSSGFAEESAGVGLLICHREQDLSQLCVAKGSLRDIPEEYVALLAKNRQVMARHLLPNLIEKITWPEKKHEVIVIGTKVVVPDAHRHPEGAVKQHLDSGEMIVGSYPAEAFGITTGMHLLFRGRTFVVKEVHSKRGNQDDNTVWLSLSDAQELLNKKGRINLIQVLECSCAWADVEIVKSELKTILPDAQVRVFGRTQAAPKEKK